MKQIWKTLPQVWVLLLSYSPPKTSKKQKNKKINKRSIKYQNQKRRPTQQQTRSSTRAYWEVMSEKQLTLWLKRLNRSQRRSLNYQFQPVLQVSLKQLNNYLAITTMKKCQTSKLNTNYTKVSQTKLMSMNNYQ